MDKKKISVMIPCYNEEENARPIYEAGIAKKPVVVTDFENTREFLDETNGWTFKKGNARMLARRIDDMFSRNAVDKVEKNYIRASSVNNLQTLAGELQSLLETVFSGDK